MLASALSLEDSPFKLDDYGPVFILGCPRSGTTFLSECVGSIRGVEEFVGVLCLPRMCHLLATEDRPDREAMLLASIRDTFWNSFWRRRHYRRDRAAQVWHGRLTVRDLLRGPSMAGGLFCYKEPFLCFAAEKFARHFRAAKFLHIVRDGRDNADSLERTYPEALSDAVLLSDELSQNKNSEIGAWAVVNGMNVPWWVSAADAGRFAEMSRYERCVLLWREMTTRAAALRRLGPERYFEVRYEDFVADPMRWGRAVVEFLGQDFGRRIQKTLGRAFRGSVGISRRNQPPAAIEKAAAIAGPLLRGFGYRA